MEPRNPNLQERGPDHSKKLVIVSGRAGGQREGAVCVCGQRRKKEKKERGAVRKNSGAEAAQLKSEGGR